MANTVKGVSINGTKFIGVTDLKTLAQSGITRPSSSEKDLKGMDKAAYNCHELRAHVQRTFNKARKDNALSYARYIRGIETQGLKGGCPPINIYCEQLCRVADGQLEIPFRAGVMAIDGETQLEARFILLDEGVEGSEDWLFPVVIWHGCGDDMARQYLVDTNLYANPISAQESISLDRTGRLTKTVKEAISLAGIADEEVNMGADLPGKRKRITLKQATAATVGYILNGHAMSSPYHNFVGELNSPMPIHERFDFDTDRTARAVAELLQVANRQDATHDAKPAVFQAAGIKARQGGDVQQFNFKTAAERLPKRKTANTIKMTAVKNAL